MKLILSMFILLFYTHLSAEYSTKEFPYIQPIAVEEVSQEATPIKPEPIIEEVVKEETKQELLVLDGDKDGVADEQDKCPNTTAGAKVNERGCEIDSDEDGVKDSLDKCPDTSKDFVVDSDGCPKTATLAINFQRYKYNIQEKYLDTLKQFTEFLKENSEYQIIIYGHTDSRASEELNRELSLKRAKSVANAFEANGVERIRITTIGKSFDEPIADNETPEGRAQNRRIEVELLR
ncbi:OmpA family protein [Sulfurimonas sp.]|nr:OmpA family protein [Sulfurimonas sp.]